MATQDSKQMRFIHGQLPVSFTAPSFSTWPPDPHGAGFYITDMDSQFGKYAPDLWALDTNPSNPGGRRANTWEELLKNCYVDLEVYEQSVPGVMDDVNKLVPTRRLIGQRYDTYTNFFNAVSALLYNHLRTKSGPMDWFNTVNATFYSMVDYSIPTIEHMSAYNRFFVAMNGSARYSKDRRSFYPASRIPFYQELIEQAWLHVWGETISYAEHLVKWNRTIWFPTYKGRNLYRLPATGKGLSLGPTGGPDAECFTYNPTTNTFDPKDGLVDWFFENMVICQMPTSKPMAATDYSWSDSVSPGDAYGSNSKLAFIGVRNGPNKAIYIKPFAGADTFVIPKFDTKQYQLECYYTQLGKTKRWAVLDADSFLSYEGHNFSPFRIPKSVIDGVMLCTTGRSGVQPLLMGDLYFYLRRKGTPDVSPVWSPYIHAEYAKRSKIAAVDLFVGYR